MRYKKTSKEKNNSVTFYLFVIGILFFFIYLPDSFLENTRLFLQNKILLLPRKKNLMIMPEDLLNDLKVKNYCLSQENENLLSILREVEAFQNTSFSIIKTEKPPFITTKVIYRDPTSWGSSLWIDVGLSSFEKTGFEIRKDAPVVSGNILIGVIDYVGEKQSRVRLITDSMVKPSIFQFENQKQASLEILRNFLIRFQDDILYSESFSKKQDVVDYFLKLFKNYSENFEKEQPLKGVLNGMGNPLWKKSRVLKGQGFMLDDDRKKRFHIGAVLATTGLDGIFPKGLFVAKVVKVSPTKEGAFFYDFEAETLIEDFDQLKIVNVLSPEIFNKKDNRDFDFIVDGEN